jgi:hypothetical protein
MDGWNFRICTEICVYLVSGTSDWQQYVGEYMEGGVDVLGLDGGRREKQELGVTGRSGCIRLGWEIETEDVLVSKG